MILTWMLYATAVGALLGLAATTAERVCRTTHRPARWAWVTALTGTLLLPLALDGTPSLPAARPATPVAPTQPNAVPAAMPALPADARSASAWVPRVERLLGLGWLLGSATLFTGLILSVRSLEQQRSTWRHGKLAGTPVRFSPDTGPAVAGFLWQEVVVPERFEEWDDQSQRLVVEHEMEHMRAGDPHLLLGALLALAFMPWNIPLWWQVRRLRFAVEVDCDERVLRRLPGVQRYGRLLVEVGHQASSARLVVMGFSESRSLLERRIRILTAPARRPGASALVALLATMVLAPTILYSVPAPRRPDLALIWDHAPETAESASLESVRDTPVPEARTAIEREPTFTAYEVAPELRNSTEVEIALARRGWQLAGDASPGPTLVLWAFVDDSGRVTNTRLVRGSGEPARDRLAEAALRETARFVPAYDRGRRVPAWVQIPLGLNASAAQPEEGPAYWLSITNTPAPPPPDGATAGRPGAPRHDTAPQLLDRQKFDALLARSYPRALHAAGIGGTAVLSVFVTNTGVVGSTRLATSSGHDELDLVAREVVRQSRFSAPRRRGRAVDGWVQLPVTFVPR